jgi:hypothetical protein
MKKLILLVALLVLFSGAALAQGNAFSFQGKLNDGANPANGRYDLEFKLFDAITGGTQIGPTVARPGTTLINGVFSTMLDFGAAAFQNPNSIFIEIAVRPFGSPNQLTILGPRQQLTVVPFAVNSQNSVNAQNATNAQNANNATTADNALQLGGVLSNEYARLSRSNQFTNSGDFRISGNIFASSITPLALQVGNINTTGNSTMYGDLTVFGSIRGGNLGSYLYNAKVRMNSSHVLVSCYNGWTQTTAGNCGFTITYPLGTAAGVVRINFGFPVIGPTGESLVSVSAEYGGSGNNNSGVNYRYYDNQTIEVFTFRSDSTDTTPRGFTLILHSPSVVGN